jgi:hypothetical protein
MNDLLIQKFISNIFQLINQLEDWGRFYISFHLRITHTYPTKKKIFAMILNKLYHKTYETKKKQLKWNTLLATRIRKSLSKKEDIWLSVETLMKKKTLQVQVTTNR